jgi:hypothetical protein
MKTRAGAAVGRSTALASLVLSAGVAVALSGCGTAHAPGATDPVSTRTGSASVPLTTAKSPAPSAAAVAPVKPAARARPASEKVPAAAQAVTISMGQGGNQGGLMNPGGNQGSQVPPKPVTITNRAQVDALKALINGLALFPPGTYSCPADFGDDLVLTFRAGPGTPALAVATADLSGCDSVSLTINGKPQPALAGPGTDNGPRILKTAGLPWKIPAS